MISPMARFGDNLRALREDVLRLDQKQLAQYLMKKKGGAMGQASLSKFEAMEFAPRPDTVMRVAEGLAPLLGQSPQEVYRRLLDGVSSRYDAAQARQMAGTDTIEQLRELIARLPPDQRASLIDALKSEENRKLKAAKKKGA